MDKILLLCNIHSGRANIKKYVLDMVNYYNSKDYEVTLYISQYVGHITDIIENVGNNFDNIVCCGGDGTLNEAVSAIYRLNKKPVLGYIPCGSTNDFANTLGLPFDISKAYKVAIEGQKRQIDIGDINGRIFTYVCAFGALTNVSYETPQNMKNMLGHLAYVLEGMKQIANIPSYKIKIEHDGGVIEDEFVLGFVANSKKVGGFKICDDDKVDIDDGLFEVLLVKSIKNINDAGDFISSFLTSNFDKDLFYFFKTTSIKFTSEEEIKWTVDGEFCGKYQIADVTIHNKVITIRK